MKLNAMSVKNLLGYIVTPLMLISVGYFVSILQDYLKHALPYNATLAVAAGLLLVLLVVLTSITYTKQKHHSGTKQSADNLGVFILRSCVLIILAILLGTMIGLAGYLVQLFLKTDINQHNLSAILIVILGLMAVAEYISYRIQSAFYWLAAGFICSVISYWLPTLANCLFLVIITLYSLKLFYVISRHLIQPYNKLFSQQPSPKTHLLLFLSPLAQHYRKTKDGTDFPLLNEIQNNASEWEIMDTNMKSYNPIINWEMPFRAIYSQLFPASGHPSKLQQVIVALSAPSTDKNGKALEGSAAMITEFVESLQALLKLWKFNQPLQLKLLIMCENTSDKKFTLCEFSASGDYKKRGINSANFEDTSAAVFFAVHTLIQQQVTESDIVIDITGWQKHTSVAGALVATVTDVHNQYIDTNSKEVTNYDFTFNDFTKLT